MVRKLLFPVLALASCAKGPEADLPAIGEARSLAAEWAMVNEQAGAGHLTNSYASSMRENIREQLKTSSKTLTQPAAAYAAEIGAILREPDDAPPSALRAHASHLKRIEDQLESD